MKFSTRRYQLYDVCVMSSSPPPVRLNSKLYASMKMWYYSYIYYLFLGAFANQFKKRILFVMHFRPCIRLHRAERLSSTGIFVKFWISFLFLGPCIFSNERNKSNKMHKLMRRLIYYRSIIPTG
jgi:hypothetical protein